jgi:hypothetical protein
MFKKIKASWQHFLESLAEQNKTNYGEGGINCCELKQANSDQPKQS